MSDQQQQPQQRRQPKSTFQRNRDEASDEITRAFESRAGKITVAVILLVIVGTIAWNTITGAIS